MKKQADYIDTNQSPLIPKGCKIIKHISCGASVNPISINKKILNGQHNQLGIIILGRLLEQNEAGIIKLLNATVLDFLLENQSIISEKYKKQGIIFWGTIFKGNNYIFVKELNWIPADNKYDYRTLDLFGNYVHSQPAAIV